jgi:cellulose synthase/poly-beta-1,6-N-acetylglucosamine synthase-like glycosyltransferase
MTAAINKALQQINEPIVVHFPNQHLGKAAALNKAVSNLQTDIILFLDNDIFLPDDNNYLSRLAAQMAKNDIVDMPKEVLATSFYSAMIGCEYQSLAIGSYLFSKIVRHSPALIGSAFAVKKELFARLGGFRQVVHEDGDFGARAFRLHSKYVYDLSLKVQTSMPNNLQAWITQRKRWTLINVLWFKENFLYLLKSIPKNPGILSVLGVMLLPSVLSFLVVILLQIFNLSFLNPLIFSLAQPYQFVAGILYWYAHHILFSQGLISMLVGFLITLTVYWGFTLLSKFRFNFFYFIVYYFVYLPVLIFINIIMFFTQFRKRTVHLDWKI